MSKRPCSCGCGAKVTHPTEARHLQLAAMFNLGSEVLNHRTLSTSRPSRKRKAGKGSSRDMNRAAKRAKQPTIRADLHSAEVGDLEFEMGDAGNMGSSSNVAPTEADANPGLEDNSNSELTRIRRSARIEASLQHIAQQYYRPNVSMHTEGEDEDDNEDGNEEETEGEGEEDDIDEDSSVNVGLGDDEWLIPDVSPGEGLSIQDLLDEDFLREMSELDGKTLDDGDIRLLKAYLLKTEDGLADRTFEKLRFLVPEANITSFKRTEARVQALSGFKPVRYDCCSQSCICYTGPHLDLTECPYCKTKRYKSEPDKIPFAYFEYLPITSRLRAMVANRDQAQKMTYRKNHVSNPNKISDVFDGTHYLNLLTEPVRIADQTMPYCHFPDDRDIALGLSTDGFAPFKRRTKTAWPLVIFNYNLPPEERFSKRNLLSAGVIPGPKKPIDMDSFLWPLVHELMQLSVGVSAFDALAKAVFMLRAFLILVFGDIPAVSLLMRMKGQNGCSPCRMCEIQGIRVPDTPTNSPLYIPLNRTNFPDAPPSYDPRNLPHRTHETFMEQAFKVQGATTNKAADELATKYGIKGVPLLSWLSSLSFPASFPYDFMHLMWGNLIKNLIKLWTGTFKGLNHQAACFKLDDKVWKAIGKETAEAGAHIPSAFGSRVPNLERDPSHLISETYSNWTLHLSPAILRNRFPQEEVYKHHLLLVGLLKCCLEYEFSQDKIDKLEDGFVRWVEGYERIYYKHDPQRASCCPLTLHALLHVASSIRAIGPVWTYWAFPMERHCGDIAQHIGSRRYPYISINRYVTSKAHIAQIRLLYNLHNELSLTEPPNHQDRFTSSRYKSFVLSPPVRAKHTLSNMLWLKLTAALSTRFEVAARIIRKLIPALTPFTEYGRVERLEGGDKMHGRDLVKLSSDSRDMSYIRYRLLIDKFAHVHKKKPDFEWREHYGQLLKVIVVDVPLPSPPNSSIKPGTYIYAIVRNFDVVSEVVGTTSIKYFVPGDEGRIEVIDLNRIKCVIGRVKSGNRWAIIDRQRVLFPVHSR